MFGRAEVIILLCMSVSTTDLKEGRINDDLETKLESLSAQVEANVERGKNKMAEWRASVSDKTSQFGTTMNRYTHEHPWRMISSGFMAGILLGLMSGCQRSHRRARF
jgi:ElaB/YqjD/DUF883 family membrane-anchored ribosome-binding protein